MEFNKILLLLTLLPTAAFAEDWKLRDGTVLKDVQVKLVTASSVTILYRDGGENVPLASLPAELQEKFHYDTAKAQAELAAKAKADAEELLAEKAARAEKDLLASVKPTVALYARVTSNFPGGCLVEADRDEMIDRVRNETQTEYDQNVERARAGIHGLADGEYFLRSDGHTIDEDLNLDVYEIGKWTSPGGDVYRCFTDKRDLAIAYARQHPGAFADAMPAPTPTPAPQAAGFGSIIDPIGPQPHH